MARFLIRNQVSSVFFNQNGSYINVTTNAGLKPTTFTVACWVMPSKFDSGTHQNNVINTENSNTGFALRIGNGTPNLFVGTGSAGPSASAPGKILGIGQWVHLMGTYDGTNIKIYVNNVEVGSTAAASFSASTNDFRIGRAHLNSRDFYGYINDIVYYDGALSATDRAALFQGNTPTTGLKLWLKCNENTGTTPQDTSGNGNHGTFVDGTGAAAWSTNRAFAARPVVT